VISLVHFQNNFSPTFRLYHGVVNVVIDKTGFFEG